MPMDMIRMCAKCGKHTVHQVRDDGGCGYIYRCIVCGRRSARDGKKIRKAKK